MEGLTKNTDSRGEGATKTSSLSTMLAMLKTPSVISMESVKFNMSVNVV